MNVLPDDAPSVSTEILRARLAAVRAALEAAEVEAIARRREERDLLDVLAMMEGRA